MGMISTNKSSKGHLYTWLQILLVSACLFGFSNAGISCDSDQFCQDLFNTPDSVCLSATKECSNPFQKGCLRSKGIKTNRTDYTSGYRVCTSAGENATNCKLPEFPYPEIRIHNADWTSSFILAWIYQIVLVEILHVPATVGLTTESTKSSGFYSANNTFQFSTATYPYDALKVANAQLLSGANCENTNDPCVHVLPEVWNGQKELWEALENEKVIEQTTSNGIVYKPSLMVPKKTLIEHPYVGNVYGLQNQTRMAQIFKKPITWLDYCEIVSANNCSLPDNTTTRYPTDEEKYRYFVEGSYTGYFLKTDKNRCTVSDSLDDCHGYVIGPPCFWTAFLDSQLYWNNIGLKLQRNLTYSQNIDIWKAANATGSHVIMWWWLATIEAQAFGNSSYSPQMVQLPQPSKECLANRPTGAERCSEDPIVRRGNPLGSCDQEYSQLQRLFATAVNQQNNRVPAADRSAATEMLTSLKVSEYDVVEILRAMLADGGKQVVTNAREAICDWVVDHIDHLEAIIPRNYPKRLTRISSVRLEHYAARVIAVLVGLCSLLCIILTHKYRKTRTMIFAQPTFLYLILFGFLLICVAAFILAIVPRDQLCVSIKWLEVLGFTVELVPVLIKTAALNRLISSSKKQQRININTRTLLRKVTVWMALVVIWLLVWTYVDPPRVSESRVLNPEDHYEVYIDRECGSRSLWWEIFQTGMEMFLLFICAILAFQTRNAISVVNDSRVLAQLVYSHFLFVILRVLVTSFDLLNLFTGDLIPVLASLNHSFDALFAMCIYVVPKIIQSKYEPTTYRGSLSGSGRTSSRLKTESKLKILVCTANMGNAEPTQESMETWIPVDGECSRVNSLAAATRELRRGYFDIVVIGMQESTWARKNTTRAVAEKEAAESNGLSEEDILNAMDKHDSTTLRLMIHDILGSEYCQIVEELRGQMRLSIWSSVNLEADIKNVRISGANTGIGNVLANKGGIVATFDYKNTRLSFVSAHLAAHEGENYYRTRLANIRSILKEGKTSDLSKKLDITMTSHHMFFLGDLNFRTKFEDTEEELPHEKCVERAMKLVDSKDYEGVYMHDELQKGLKKGDLLHGFETLPCDFPPTFKVEREAGFVYKKQRTPSYTDRILFKSMDGFRSQLKPLAYEPCVDFITSDHKPIRGAFSITPCEEVKPIGMKGKLIIKLSDMKAFDLPIADSSGKADPYVMLMWEGVDLVAHNLSLQDQLRRYYNGKFWPRTKYRSKTLDPVWDEESIHVEEDSPTVQKGAFLHVLLMDHENVGRDDFMCAATLSLWDLCKQGTTTHEMNVPLTCDGTVAGRIEFKLFVFVPPTERPSGLSRRGSIASFINRHRGSVAGGGTSSGREASGILSMSNRVSSRFDSSRREDVSHSHRDDEVLGAIGETQESPSAEEVASEKDPSQNTQEA